MQFEKIKQMKHILLIEDDPFLVDIYITKLEEANFKIEVAIDGKEALTKLKEKKPDLVVLDIILPHIDGWEILRKIKQDPKLKDLKVIVLSNLGQKEEIERGLKLGAIKYLIKAHYAPSEVIEEIKKCLQ